MYVGGRLVAAELVRLDGVATGGGLLGLGDGQEHLCQQGGGEEAHLLDLRKGEGGHKKDRYCQTLIL